MPSPTIIDRGTPVASPRQLTTGLSRNAANTDWNYIVCASSGAPGIAIEWPVIKNFTTSPSKTIYETVTHAFANLIFQYTNQLRAANGRIFFPCVDLYTCYYDPTDEQVHEIGPIIETAQPVNPNASTLLYSASFDVDGLLYMGTQESTNRAAMVCVTDTNTLAQTVLGYVGDSATGFTTYAYRLAPDTHGGTGQKWIYVVYGESPWQLWALNITTGVAHKMLDPGGTPIDISSSGNIQFVDIAGKGWTAIIDTDLGQLDNVRTQLWCIDGLTHAYSVGVDPPVTPRNVTPQSNPLTGSPPDLDIYRGIGEFGWRNGTSGPYTYVNYTVNHTFPVAIESLVALSPNDGILGNAAGYSGFFEADSSVTWDGAWGGVSEGPRLNVGGTIYFAGYPNGVLYKYDPTATWDPLVAGNPTLIGYIGLNGTQFAGIKYTDALAWSASAGASGRLYCVGERQRNGTGAGIGYWDKTLNAFAGTYGPANAQSTAPLPVPASSPTMDAVLPSGIVTLPLGRSPSIVTFDGISRVAFATRNISGTGDGVLFVFDLDLNYIGQYTPLATTTNPASNLGDIYKSSTANVITGIVQGSGNSLGLYQYNVQTASRVAYVELPIVGTLGAACQKPDGSVWIISGTSLVKIDIDALTATVIEDLSSITPVAVMGFAGDGHTLYMAAGSPSGVSGAELYSLDTTPPSGPLFMTSTQTFDNTFDRTFDILVPTRTFDSTFDITFDIDTTPSKYARVMRALMPPGRLWRDV